MWYSSPSDGPAVTHPMDNGQDALGMVEGMGEYGEAPDGEEYEREMGESVVVYRITGLGVAALSESDRGQ